MASLRPTTRTAAGPWAAHRYSSRRDSPRIGVCPRRQGRAIRDEVAGYSRSDRHERIVASRSRSSSLTSAASGVRLTAIVEPEIAAAAVRPCPMGHRVRRCRPVGVLEPGARVQMFTARDAGTVLLALLETIGSEHAQREAQDHGARAHERVLRWRDVKQGARRKSDAALASLWKRGAAAGEGFTEGYAARDAIVRVGAMLRRMREDAGLTQAELAQRAAMDQSDISRLERGLRKAWPERGDTRARDRGARARARGRRASDPGRHGWGARQARPTRGPSGERAGSTITPRPEWCSLGRWDRIDHQLLVIGVIAFLYGALTRLLLLALG